VSKLTNLQDLGEELCNQGLNLNNGSATPAEVSAFCRVARSMIGVRKVGLIYGQKALDEQFKK
jgi:hypothetical protein